MCAMTSCESCFLTQVSTYFMLDTWNNFYHLDREKSRRKLFRCWLLYGTCRMVHVDKLSIILKLRKHSPSHDTPVKFGLCSESILLSSLVQVSTFLDFSCNCKPCMAPIKWDKFDTDFCPVFFQRYNTSVSVSY